MGPLSLSLAAWLRALFIVTRGLSTAVTRCSGDDVKPPESSHIQADIPASLAVNYQRLKPKL